VPRLAIMTLALALLAEPIRDGEFVLARSLGIG
jgi:hypothetical protein